MAGGDIFSKALSKKMAQARSAKGKTLEVGFFEDATYSSDDGGAKVAEIAAYAEFGVPENNQPPRPFFRTAISSNFDIWLSNAKKWIANGDSFDVVMGKLGVLIQQDIQKSILEFNDPKLSPITIAIKKANGKSDSDAAKPLIDTWTMYRNVQWSITQND